MALAAAVAGRGCQSEVDGPTDAVRAFLDASKNGDRATVFKLLGPKTHTRLEVAAKRATELVGGERRYEAADMLRPMQASSGITFETLSQNNEEAIVELTDSTGLRSKVRLLLIDKKWRIELDRPEAQ